MKLLETLSQEDLTARKKVFSALVLSGFANAAVVVLVNAAAGVPTDESAQWQLPLYFTMVLILYVVSIRRAANVLTIVIENTVDRVRRRLTRYLYEAELATVERLGQGNIYNLLAHDMNRISEIKIDILWAGHACVFLFCTSMYMVFLSIEFFLLVMALALIGAFTYWRREQAALPSLNRAIKSQEELVDHVNEVLEGYNELKINERRRNDAYADFLAIASRQRESVIESDTISIKNTVFVRYFYFFTLGVTIFLLPKLIPGVVEDTADLATTVVFIMTPISVIMSAFPRIVRANLAAENIDAFERAFEKINEQLVDPEPMRTRPQQPFTEIVVDNAEFSYVDAEGNPLFTVGPMNLRIKSGETLFLIGGNGSGKSTVLKMLTALYALDSGEITLDGEVVTRAKVQDFRERFSIILSEFHVFRKLYGIADVHLEKVDELLHLMQLQDKTSLVNDCFTSLDVSGGQRKRLAMVVALLEDRPIFVFDEWAADQDPEFRKFFYEGMLKAFKDRGKTVIAVTHDDRYFHVADKIVKMDYGRIVEES